MKELLSQGANNEAQDYNQKLPIDYAQNDFIKLQLLEDRNQDPESRFSPEFRLSLTHEKKLKRASEKSRASGL